MIHPLCPICSTPGRACGDDHISAPVIDSATIKGVAVAEQPLELKEYEYYVGHMPITAMLTDEMAQRLDAKPVGEAQDPKPGEVPNNTAQQVSTHMRDSDEHGVDGPESEAVNKARETRNRRAH